MPSEQVQQAQQQIAQQKAIIEQRQQEAQQAAQQLQQARRKLPTTTSQQALRGQYAGLQGRVARRQVSAVGKDISTREQEVKAFQTETQQAKEQIARVEQDISKQARYEEGYRLALEDKSANRTTYLKDHDPDLVKGYKDALSYIASEEARYGTPELTFKYGTALEKERVKPYVPAEEIKAYKPALKEIRIYNDTQGLNIPKYTSGKGQNGFGTITGAVIGGDSRISMGDVTGDSNKSFVVDNNWWSNLGSSIKTAFKGQEENGKQFVQFGNQTLVSAAIPTATIIEPASGISSTFVEVGSPPTITQFYVDPVKQKIYETVKNKEIFGKPIWAIREGIPTYKTTIVDGALVPLKVDKETGRPVESGKGIQTAYDVSSAIYGGTQLYSERLIRDFPEQFSTPEEQAKITESFKSPIVKTRENVINFINPPQVIWNLDTGTSTIGERKGGIIRSIAAGTASFFMPSNIKELIPVAAIGYGGTLFKYLPTAAGYALGGLGTASSTYGYATAKTSEEKMAYGAGIALSTLPFLFAGSKYIQRKYQTGKYEKFFNPEVSVINLKERVGYNPLNTERKIPRAELISQDNVYRINLKNKARGAIQEVDFFGTGEYAGPLVEKIDTRSTIRKIVDLFGRGKKSEPTTFTGQATLNPEGEFISKIDYGKYQKVTKLNAAGEGKIELFKGKKLLATRTSTSLPNQDTVNVKNKVIKVNIDEQINNPVNIEEASFSLGNVKVKNLRGVISQEGGEAVFNFQGDSPNPYLKATKVTGALESKITKTTNLKQGAINFNIQDYASTDIIQTGPRKGQIEVRVGGKNIKLTKKVGQKIVEGEDIEKDVIFRNLQEDKLRMKKAISPSVDRTITEGQQGELFQIRVNPKSKLLNPAKELAEASKAKSAEIVKRIKSEENLRKAKEILGAFNEYLKLYTKKANGKNINIKDARMAGIEGDSLPSMVGGNNGGSLYDMEFAQSSLGEIAKFKFGKGLPPTGNLINRRALIDAERYFSSLSKEVSVPSSSNYLQGMKSSSANIPISNLVPEKVSLNKISYVTGISNKIEPAYNQELTMQVGTKVTPAVVTELSLLDSKVKLDYKINQQFKNISKLETKFRTDEMILTKFMTKLNNRQMEKLQSKQSSKQKLNQKQNRQPEPTKPKEEFIINPDFGLKKETGKLSSSQLKSLIEIFAKRRGKDILIGEARTAKEAGEFLKGKLKSSLAASGFARVKGGSKIGLEELGIAGKEFGTAKRDIYRVVQKRGFRLGTGREVSEILAAKKKKGKGSKLKWF